MPFPDWSGCQIPAGTIESPVVRFQQSSCEVSRRQDSAIQPSVLQSSLSSLQLSPTVVVKFPQSRQSGLQLASYRLTTEQAVNCSAGTIVPWGRHRISAACQVSSRHGCLSTNLQKVYSRRSSELPRGGRLLREARHPDLTLPCYLIVPCRYDDLL